MPRKLVTVRRVSAVRPIAGADRIEAVTVDGWTCVAKVGCFHQDDLALFFEIDSFLPATDPRWAYLEQKFITYDGTRGFRVRSIKIRGQISQGILTTLDEFPEVAARRAELEAQLLDSGADTATTESVDGMLLSKESFEDVLGVRKYDTATASESKKWEDKNGANENTPSPEFIPRTDQERVQNLKPGTLEMWHDEIFQETTKMDGTSMTVYFVRNSSPLFGRLPALPNQDAEGEPPVTGNRRGDAVQPNGRVGVCSRRMEKWENRGGHFWAAARHHELPRKLSALGRNIAVQGELCGSTIQGNFEGFPAGTHDFFVFTIWDMDARRYLVPMETEDLAVRILGLRHVPVVGYGPLRCFGSTVDDFLARAEGFGLNGRKREGIVLKHIDGQFGFKAISNSYLLKHGE